MESYGLTMAADNSAYSQFKVNEFKAFVNRTMGVPIQWLAVPDSVANAPLTLYLFEWWEYELRKLPLALVAQDGMEEYRIPWSRFKCLFIGGTTDWKLSRAALCVGDEKRNDGGNGYTWAG